MSASAYCSLYADKDPPYSKILPRSGSMQPSVFSRASTLCKSTYPTLYDIPTPYWKSAASQPFDNIHPQECISEGHIFLEEPYLSSTPGNSLHPVVSSQYTQRYLFGREDPREKQIARIQAEPENGATVPNVARANDTNMQPISLETR